MATTTRVLTVGYAGTQTLNKAPMVGRGGCATATHLSRQMSSCTNRPMAA